jgi:hypothetical protein
MASEAKTADLTAARSFIEACLDERQHDGFRRMRERLSPEFRAWADDQYAALDAAPKWPQVLDTALGKEPREGMLCEFGVCTGNSTNLIAKKIAPREVFGFDSFEGLPDDWVIGNIRVPKGFLAIDPAKLHFEPNVKLVKGYFCDSLPGFLETHAGPVALLHIDCDTYESTVDILKHTSPRFQVGTVIVFDEVLGDMGTENELKAFYELLQKRPFGFEWLARGGHCWTAETQARFHSIKRNDFLWSLKFALRNPGQVLGYLRNKKKVEDALSAAALRITSLPG